MQIDLTQIILAIITLLFGIITKYVIPNIKAKTNANQMELIRGAVQSAVYAVEQLYKSTPGKEKKQKVIEALAKQGYILDVDNVEENIDLLIEAFVKQLNLEQNEHNNK